MVCTLPSCDCFAMKHERNEVQGTMTAPSPEYLRTDDAARLVSVAPKTIRTWVDRRILPAFKPTKRMILIKVSDLEKAMARFRVGP